MAFYLEVFVEHYFFHDYLRAFPGGIFVVERSCPSGAANL